MLRSTPLLCLLLAVLVQADEKVQSLDAINSAASQFLSAQLAAYGDKASFQLGKLDKRLKLSSCSSLSVLLPQGNRLVGNTSVRVMCSQGARWSVNLPVAVSIQTAYWVSTRALPAGHELGDADMEMRSGDLAQLAPTVITEAEQALGRTLIGGLPASAPLRSDQLRAPFAVRNNEVVKVIASGNGFEVASEGRAMGNASEGQTVSVKMASGAVVQGIARAGGRVDVRY